MYEKMIIGLNPIRILRAIVRFCVYIIIKSRNVCPRNSKSRSRIACPLEIALAIGTVNGNLLQMYIKVQNENVRMCLQRLIVGPVFCSLLNPPFVAHFIHCSLMADSPV